MNCPPTNSISDVESRSSFRSFSSSLTGESLQSLGCFKDEDCSDLFANDEGSRSEKSTNTVTSTGSMCFILQSLRDDMSRMSNPKCARRFNKTEKHCDIENTPTDEVGHVVETSSGSCQNSPKDLSITRSVEGNIKSNYCSSSTESLHSFGYYEDEDCDVLFNNDDSRSEKSTKTVTSTGSMCLILQSLRDDMSRMSNPRCARRSNKKEKHCVIENTPTDVVGHDVETSNGSCQNLSKDLSIPPFAEVKVDSNYCDEILFEVARLISGSSTESMGIVLEELKRNLGNHRCGNKRAKENFGCDGDRENASYQCRDDEQRESNEKDEFDRPGFYQQKSDRQHFIRTVEASENSQNTEVSQQEQTNINNSSKEKRVAFSHVEIRHYERILGDHPSCSNGPPISIGWNYSPSMTETISVDYFEESLTTKLRGTNRPLAMVMSRKKRTTQLLGLGYTQKDLAGAVRANVKTKARRRQTIQNLYAADLEELVEKVGRKAKNVLLGKKKGMGKEGEPDKVSNFSSKSKGDITLNPNPTI